MSLIPRASATVRDNVLFVQFTNRTDYFGNVYAFYPVLGSDGHAGNGSLFMRTQNVFGYTGLYSPERPFSPKRISMMSTRTQFSNTSSTGRDFLMTLDNLAPLDSTFVPRRPLVFRLVQTSPLTDSVDGAPPITSDDWSIKHLEMEEALLLPTNAAWLSVVSDVASPEPNATPLGPENKEGSGLYELYLGNSGYMLQRIKIYQQNEAGNSVPEIVWTREMNFVKKDVLSQVVRFHDNGHYSGAVIGQCTTSALKTCLGFFNADQLQVVSLMMGDNALLADGLSWECVVYSTFSRLLAPQMSIIDRLAV